MARDEFSQLVDEHYQMLFRFALSLAKNPADAGDLTQQTFLIWARRGQTLRDKGKAKAWLFSTLYREFLRGRRQAGRVTALEDLSPAEADPAAPEVDFVTGKHAGLVPDAMAEVDGIYQVPLTLFYLRDFSYKEIAEVLEVPIGTVMSRISRGKEQLRAAVAARQTGDEPRFIPAQPVPARIFS